MDKAFAISSKIAFIGSLNPEAWDALIPHGPKPERIPEWYHELLVADVVKTIGETMAGSTGKKAIEVARAIAKDAATAMENGFEPGDDICPSRPWPWPGPPPWQAILQQITEADPDPHPWKSIAAAEQMQLAYDLTKAAGLTSNAAHSASLKKLATEAVRSFGSQTMEEFEQCGTKPRKPIPRPH